MSLNFLILKPDEAQQRLLRWHGQAMFGAWMFFFPVAAFIGRYYKETYRKISICGVKLWIFVSSIAHIIIPLF